VPSTTNARTNHITNVGPLGTGTPRQATSASLRRILQQRQVYVLVLASILTVTLSLNSEWLAGPGSPWFFAAYATLLCVLVTRRFWPLLVACFIGVTWALAAISNEKIALTELPLTVLDLKILVRNPQGLLDALNISSWIVAGVIGIVLACAVAILHVAATLVTRTPHVSVARAARGGATTMLAVALFSVPFGLFIRNYLHAVYQTDGDTWEPQGLAALSHRLGIAGFLAYSYGLEYRQTGDYFNAAVSAMPPADADIDRAAATFVRPRPVSGDNLPNIVVVLGESTFNVNEAFNLTAPVRSDLFEPNVFTQALGSLYVNAVGGGTWLSEFESIVGVDERLFGYTGYYTHSSLSPFVKRTFADYLRERGYSTAAYYPVGGEFYNARNAYRQYGFERFFDGAELGLKANWEATDDDVAAAVIARPAADSSRPFFRYVVLIENHAPHRCAAATEAGFVTAFAGAATFEENCVLNEYLRRMRSTGRGVQRLLQHLQQVEAASGRPFVLLVFGDHQPHTFTDSTSAPYARYRTSVDTRHTFFHLMSSVRDVVTCCGNGVPHATMLPTLLSAYVAASSRDLYLPVNLYQFEECGSDLTALTSWQGAEWDERKADRRCAVYANLVSAYRASGTF
jgi:phosphoglycerol transferase MdoB-like AlkP superfamily enzyme